MSHHAVTHFMFLSSHTKVTFTFPHFLSFSQRSSSIDAELFGVALRRGAKAAMVAKTSLCHSWPLSSGVSILLLLLFVQI